MLKPVAEFTKASNFLYLFIASIIVGSIFGMDRQVLIKGFLKIFVPLAAGSVVAGTAGALIGVALGLGYWRSPRARRLPHLLFHRDPDHGRRHRRGGDPAVDRLFRDPAPGAGSAVRCPPRFFRRSCSAV
jgi:2-hydroxycarboxylate transporter family